MLSNRRTFWRAADNAFSVLHSSVGTVSRYLDSHKNVQVALLIGSVINFNLQTYSTVVWPCHSIHFKDWTIGWWKWVLSLLKSDGTESKMAITNFPTCFLAWFSCWAIVTKRIYFGTQDKHSFGWPNSCTHHLMFNENWKMLKALAYSILNHKTILMQQQQTFEVSNLLSFVPNDALYFCPVKFLDIVQAFSTKLER